MVNIANKKIPSNKKIATSLTYLYGIGDFTAGQIIKKAEVENKRTSDLTETEIAKISKITESFPIEGALREQVQKIISEQINLGTYYGLRRLKKLPLRSSSRHNARTAKKGQDKFGRTLPGKGIRIAVAGKKKAPSPK